MNKFLLDVNVLLDIVFKRDTISIALLESLINSEAELYITASMIPILDYFLNKYKVDKRRFKKKFLERFKIITSSGKDADEAMSYEDGEDALIVLSFKRVCPDGIVITSDKRLEGVELLVYTPFELLKVIENKDQQKTREQIPILNLQEEYRYMLEDIDEAVLKNIADAKYILGPEVKMLEESVARYLKVKHCIGISSGTDALVLSLRAMAISVKGKEYFDKQDEIITTPFTFTATGDAILRSGATPVFVDIDPATYNIDSTIIRKYLQEDCSRVIGIIPVHLYGQPCKMEEIISIAEEYNLFVLEDVAQAFGAMWKDKKLGSIGNAGAFSFFPSKNLGGFGDSGMVATNNDEIADMVRML